MHYGGNIYQYWRLKTDTFLFQKQVTVPGATSATTARYSTTWAAKCVTPRGIVAATALTYTYTNMQDKYGNIETAIFNQASTGVTYVGSCTIESTRPVLVFADFDVPVVLPGGAVVLSLWFSEVVASPPVSIAGVTVASGNIVETSDATRDGALSDKWTVNVTIPTDQLDGPLPFTVGPDVVDKNGNKNQHQYVRPQGVQSDRPLVDGTAPVLRLISFVSDNTFDDKKVIAGDTIRLTFESNEFTTKPTVTVGGATATVTAAHRAGVAARGFIDPERPTIGGYPRIGLDAREIAVTWIATVTVSSSFTPITGDIPWTATSFTDVAGNAGVASNCGDWLPACAAVYATQVRPRAFPKSKH